MSQNRRVRERGQKMSNLHENCRTEEKGEQTTKSQHVRKSGEIKPNPIAFVFPVTFIFTPGCRCPLGGNSVERQTLEQSRGSARETAKKNGRRRAKFQDCYWSRAHTVHILILFRSDLSLLFNNE